MNESYDRSVRTDGAGYKQRVRGLIAKHRDTLERLDE